MSIPNVFISYSHDSQEHKKWVLDLATRLINTGVNAIIDQWELKPGDDLPLFMERNLSSSDYILMICTENYVQKANIGIGGVGYEKMIITSELMSNIDNNKVIPIIRQHGTREVPIFVKTKLFIDFSYTSNFEFSYDELIRTVHNAPLYVKPEIGNNPFKPVETLRPQKSNTALVDLMRIVVSDFEKGENWTVYKELIKKYPVSRILMDMVIDEAVAEGLITLDGDGDLRITTQGKHYAVEHDLIK